MPIKLLWDLVSLQFQKYVTTYLLHMRIRHMIIYPEILDETNFLKKAKCSTVQLNQVCSVHYMKAYIFGLKMGLNQNLYEDCP